MAEPINLSCWYYDFAKRKIVLVMSNGRNWLFDRVSSVMALDDAILSPIYREKIPEGSMCDKTLRLKRKLAEKFQDQAVETEEEEEEEDEEEEEEFEGKKVVSWEFSASDTKVIIRYEKDRASFMDLNEIGGSEDKSFLSQLSKIPMVDHSGSSIASNLENLVKERVEAWPETEEEEEDMVESEEEEESSDGEEGYVSEPSFDF